MQESSQGNEAIGTETSATTSGKAPFTKEGEVQIGRRVQNQGVRMYRWCGLP